MNTVFLPFSAPWLRQGPQPPQTVRSVFQCWWVSCALMLSYFSLLTLPIASKPNFDFRRASPHINRHIICDAEKADLLLAPLVANPPLIIALDLEANPGKTNATDRTHLVQLRTHKDMFLVHLACMNGVFTQFSRDLVDVLTDLLQMKCPTRLG